MEYSENLNWLSILFLGFMSIFFSSNFINILVLWVIIILVAGNAKRVYIKEYEYILCYIRRMLYVLPFFAAIETNFWDLENKMFIFLGGLLGCALQMPKLKDWLLVWDYELIKLNVKKSYDYASYVIMLIFVPIAEEFFFRAFILSQTSNIVLGVFTSTILFVINHFGTKWNFRFNLYDLMIQIAFSLLSCWLFVVSHSVTPCVIAHAAYNAPMLILNIRGYIICKKCDFR